MVAQQIVLAYVQVAVVIDRFAEQSGFVQKVVVAQFAEWVGPVRKVVAVRLVG